MDRRIIFTVLFAAIVGGAGFWMLLPDEIDDSNGARLPWSTSLDAQGRLQVFGFTIGVTPLAEVQEAFGEPGKLTLFANEEAEPPLTVEAFFDQVYLDRLRAAFVVTLDAEQEELARMYERGLRISRLGNGTRKVTLAPADKESLRQMPIAHITYLPMAQLSIELLESRFGVPPNWVTDSKGVTHWLYPDKGMDLGRDAHGNIVIQYVNPSDYERVLAPLRADLAKTDE
ncbi:hypothetical protein Thimo_1094 [Thioflavicoccus mobilis 8321]|uniref:Uncharacterized protein n=1 Tax=Thioflavicoccus mobilis 8321 TaxID=765912 RepID=L0GSZ8_9GAMM|nr:hypothetical protein [Thioflavicoccus mobilis]AGA89898.1 hypothetical protein Thimo_1094 [Thioflavicoccus mobilis 8321]